MTKLSNVKGRITYISSHAKQENLYAVYETTERKFWRELAKCNQEEFAKSGTEGKCIEARELIIALPESFTEYQPDRLLQLFTNHFKQNYGTECIAALHHNKRKTNYHIHLIFAERKLLDEPIIKIASRNMFYDENGKHVRTKKEILGEDGEIREGSSIVKKGEVYEKKLFTAKDERFKCNSFLDEVKHSYTDLINIYVQDEKQKLQVFERGSVYLATKKIGKNNPKAQEIEVDNQKRREWNRAVDMALISGVPEPKIMEVKRKEITEPIRESIARRGNRPRLFSRVVTVAVGYNGKLPILVGENFLREMFEMDGVSVISHKCNIHVISNIFDNIESEMKRVELAKEAYVFLEDLKNDIQENKEAGYIGYYGFYEDEHKRKNEIFTNDFLDLFHYASLNSHILVCDDRWANSYNNFNDCFIYSVTDIVELLHEQRIISDEKYINVITQMFNEGYAYIVPPFEYMKLLLEQVPDGKDVSQEIPEELSIMCDYLVYITASESKLDDDMIHQGVMPESAGYMYNLQRELTKLMKYVWCTERGELWKCQVSDWLLANYSVFSYRTVMNESVDSGNQNYYELELSNFLFSGFCEIPGNSYRKEYYSWLFNWFSKNNQWKNGLEDRLIQSLANLISEVYRHESGTPYKDIGIGMLVLSVTADMPEYYRNLIRKNASIAPIIEKFEDNFVYLGEKDFILREHFNQWLEDAMKQGIDCSIIRTNETTKREYTITFIVNELFHQGFRIEYIDDARNKRIYYFRIDQASFTYEEDVLTLTLIDIGMLADLFSM